MQEKGEEMGWKDDETEIRNLRLYNEHKGEGKYRYRRRVPKKVGERIRKGYLYRKLGRTKKDVVGNWPDVHADDEAI